MSGITVGIDGSHNSHRALDWAVQEAATRHCGLTVLTVHPVIASWVTGNPVALPADKGLQEKERLAVEEATQKALKDAEPAKPAAVQVRSIMGFPAEELIGASKDSDLLVLGARGGGGFHRLTLGSISTQIAHHAACPVVIVPGPERYPVLTGTGDLGRRLAKQRERCGLSRAETADRADIAVSYLEYLETSAIADPGPDVLIRLADALGTTAAALSGGGLGPPPGQRRAAGHPVLAELTPAGCRDLLAPGGVGRFLFVTDRGPVAVPVNYRMLGDDIVLRTSESGSAAAATAQPRVSFSVDPSTKRWPKAGACWPAARRRSSPTRRGH